MIFKVLIDQIFDPLRLVALLYGWWWWGAFSRPEPEVQARDI